ncbi:hypothetical protein BLNAU_15226 [Blattamonas nauphoetae]|uniref:Uncharacterized protein n=1 Tax=Blattamonas nauphoetae TaxID=2049346 RepID=A0ABQ9XD13_9EUKA|nr:hypothetical protein BLNAU_15226 [Blattamonas nauphoetae]
MHQQEQQRFTIVARGCHAPMLILFIIGFLLMAAAIPVCIYFEPGLLGIGITLPLLPMIYGLIFGVGYGRRITITVDAAENAFTMTINEGCLRRCMTCCCPSGLRGTSTYKFTDVMRVNSVPSCGQSQLQILFMNGYIFNSASTFKTMDAMRFGQAVNGYLIQHAPQNLANAQLMHPMQFRGNQPMSYPPLVGYPQQPGYTAQPGYPAQPVYSAQPQVVQGYAPPPGAYAQPTQPPTQLTQPCSNCSARGVQCTYKLVSSKMKQFSASSQQKQYQTPSPIPNPALSINTPFPAGNVTFMHNQRNRPLPPINSFSNQSSFQKTDPLQHRPLFGQALQSQIESQMLEAELTVQTMFDDIRFPFLEISHSYKMLYLEIFRRYLNQADGLLGQNISYFKFFPFRIQEFLRLMKQKKRQSEISASETASFPHPTAQRTDTMVSPTPRFTTLEQSCIHYFFALHVQFYAIIAIAAHSIGHFCASSLAIRQARLYSSMLHDAIECIPNQKLAVHRRIKATMPAYNPLISTIHTHTSNKSHAASMEFLRKMTDSLMFPTNTMPQQDASSPESTSNLSNSQIFNTPIPGSVLLTSSPFSLLLHSLIFTDSLTTTLPFTDSELMDACFVVDYLTGEELINKFYALSYQSTFRSNETTDLVFSVMSSQFCQDALFSRYSPLNTMVMPCHPRINEILSRANRAAKRPPPPIHRGAPLTHMPSEFDAKEVYGFQQLSVGTESGQSIEKLLDDYDHACTSFYTFLATHTSHPSAYQNQLVDFLGEMLRTILESFLSVTHPNHRQLAHLLFHTANQLQFPALTPPQPHSSSHTSVSPERPVQEPQTIKSELSPPISPSPSHPVTPSAKQIQSKLHIMDTLLRPSSRYLSLLDYVIKNRSLAFLFPLLVDSFYSSMNTVSVVSHSFMLTHHPILTAAIPPDTTKVAKLRRLAGQSDDEDFPNPSPTPIESKVLNNFLNRKKIPEEDTEFGHLFSPGNVIATDGYGSFFSRSIGVAFNLYQNSEEPLQTSRIIIHSSMYSTIMLFLSFLPSCLPLFSSSVQLKTLSLSQYKLSTTQLFSLLLSIADTQNKLVAAGMRLTKPYLHICVPLDDTHQYSPFFPPADAKIVSCEARMNGTEMGGMDGEAMTAHGIHRNDDPFDDLHAPIPLLVTPEIPAGYRIYASLCLFDAFNPSALITLHPLSEEEAAAKMTGTDQNENLSSFFSSTFARTQATSTPPAPFETTTVRCPCGRRLTDGIDFENRLIVKMRPTFVDEKAIIADKLRHREKRGRKEQEDDALIGMDLNGDSEADLVTPEQRTVRSPSAQQQPWNMPNTPVRFPSLNQPPLRAFSISSGQVNLATFESEFWQSPYQDTYHFIESFFFRPQTKRRQTLVNMLKQRVAQSINASDGQAGVLPKTEQATNEEEEKTPLLPSLAEIIDWCASSLPQLGFQTTPHPLLPPSFTGAASVSPPPCLFMTINSLTLLSLAAIILHITESSDENVTSSLPLLLCINSTCILREIISSLGVLPLLPSTLTPVPFLSTTLLFSQILSSEARLIKNPSIVNLEAIEHFFIHLQLLRFFKDDQRLNQCLTLSATFFERLINPKQPQNQTLSMSADRAEPNTPAPTVHNCLSTLLSRTAAFYLDHADHIPLLHQTFPSEDSQALSLNIAHGDSVSVTASGAFVFDDFTEDGLLGELLGGSVREDRQIGAEKRKELRQRLRNYTRTPRSESEETPTDEERRDGKKDKLAIAIGPSKYIFDSNSVHGWNTFTHKYTGKGDERDGKKANKRKTAAYDAESGQNGEITKTKRASADESDTHIEMNQGEMEWGQAAGSSPHISGHIFASPSSSSYTSFQSPSLFSAFVSPHTTPLLSSSSSSPELNLLGHVNTNMFPGGLFSSVDTFDFDGFFTPKKAVKFLKSVDPDDEESADAYLSSFASNSDTSLTKFLQFIVVLISSPNLVITAASMKMLQRFTLTCSAKLRLALVRADLITQLIVTLNPQSLSFAEAASIHINVMKSITLSFCLSTRDGLASLEIEDGDEQQAVQETIFRQVVAPSEKMPSGNGTKKGEKCDRCGRQCIEY